MRLDVLIMILVVLLCLRALTERAATQTQTMDPRLGHCYRALHWHGKRWTTGYTFEEIPCP